MDAKYQNWQNPDGQLMHMLLQNAGIAFVLT